MFVAISRSHSKCFMCSGFRCNFISLSFSGNYLIHAKIIMVREKKFVRKFGVLKIIAHMTASYLSINFICPRYSISSIKYHENQIMTVTTQIDDLHLLCLFKHITFNSALTIEVTVCSFLKLIDYREFGENDFC